MSSLISSIYHSMTSTCEGVSQHIQTYKKTYISAATFAAGLVVASLIYYMRQEGEMPQSLEDRNISNLNGSIPTHASSIPEDSDEEGSIFSSMKFFKLDETASLPCQYRLPSIHAQDIESYCLGPFYKSWSWIYI